MQQHAYLYSYVFWFDLPDLLDCDLWKQLRVHRCWWHSFRTAAVCFVSTANHAYSNIAVSYHSLAHYHCTDNPFAHYPGSYYCFSHYRSTTDNRVAHDRNSYYGGPYGCSNGASCD